jgi:hypothetical protein
MMLVSEVKALCAYARGKSVNFCSETTLINGYVLVTRPLRKRFNGRFLQPKFHYFITLPDSFGTIVVENDSAASFAPIAARYMNAHPLSEGSK